MKQRRDPTTYIEELQGIPDEQDEFDPLLNFRRRTVIRYMDRLPEDATVGTTELARVCGAVEHAKPYHELTSHEYRMAYQALRERDLKHLSIDGIIDKEDKETIRRGEQFERYARVLEAADSVLG